MTRFLSRVPLLTQTERDFLLGKREFSKEQQYYLKSRLLKKVKALYGTELPLLDERGYLAACSKNLAAGYKVLEDKDGRWSSLVMIPTSDVIVVDTERDKSIMVGRARVGLAIPAMSRRMKRVIIIIIITAGLRSPNLPRPTLM